MKHIKTSYKCIAALLCLTMLLPLAACGETKQSQREIFAMDTIMTLTAYGNQREAGLDAAQSIIQAMDADLDPELETSTTYAINHANGANVSISGQVAKMLSCAYDVYKKSNGALDLTLYPVIKRWGFVDGRYYVPTDEELASDLALRCFDVCRVPKDQLARMEHCLNELNRRRRWYHFYMDEEGGVVAACDAVVAPGTAGPVGMELILRGVDAVDESYPILMKALWSGKE